MLFRGIGVKGVEYRRSQPFPDFVYEITRCKKSYQQNIVCDKKALGNGNKQQFITSSMFWCEAAGRRWHAALQECVFCVVRALAWTQSCIPDIYFNKIYFCKQGQDYNSKYNNGALAKQS